MGEKGIRTIWLRNIIDIGYAHKGSCKKLCLFWISQVFFHHSYFFSYSPKTFISGLSRFKIIYICKNSTNPLKLGGEEAIGISWHFHKECYLFGRLPWDDIDGWCLLGRKDRGHSVDRFSNRSRGTKVSFLDFFLLFILNKLMYSYVVQLISYKRYLECTQKIY